MGYETQRHYHSNMRWVFDQMNSGPGVNQRCIQANAAAGEQWKCIFAEHTSPHIETPIFPLQGAYDSWQLGNVLGSGDVALVNAFGQNLTARVEANLLNVGGTKHGIFLDSCKHHCGGWGSYTVDGKNQPVAFQEWYEKGSAAMENHGYFTQAKPYECTDCCVPRVDGVNIWRQATNPVTSQSGVVGYEPIDVAYGSDFGGLEYNAGHECLLDGNVGLSTWWYAVGTKAKFNGGIPGPKVLGKGYTTQPVVELFVRSADDSNWVLMLRQTDGQFFAQDEFAKNKANPDADIYAALDELDSHRMEDGKFVFKLQWPQPASEHDLVV